MEEIIISEDNNTVNVGDEIHKFNDGADNNCDSCSLFSKCCELQETVESEFPFPCVLRIDGQYGSFKILEKNEK